MTTPYHANLGEIRAFVLALFRYAGEGTYISLRAFEQGDSGAAPPRFITPLRVNGDMEKVVRDAAIAAETAAQCDTPLVFCPPICTFSNGFRARLVDLANGLALSVEVDDGDPDEARLKLEAILGPPTFIVRSGSSWTDPVTGEIKPKIHLHWRLNEPTTTAEDHDRLRHARSMATLLCGGDPTAKPVVHPLRWPGSWNMKNTARPTMATGIPVDVDVEIDLGDAIEKLEAAVEAAGLLKSGDSPGGSGESSTPEARLKDVVSAMAALPNPGEDVSYQQWVRLGYAVCRATGNAPEAFDIWDRWSQKSAKYDAQRTAATWKRILNATTGGDPPKTVGAGTIFYLASAAGWVRPIPFAFKGNGHDAANDDAFDPGKPIPPFEATDVATLDFENMQPRQWVYGREIIRGFVSVLASPGGTGKTAYTMVVGVSIALGRSLFSPGMGAAPPNLAVHKQGNVWFYNLEDPSDELRRRLKAVMLFHKVSLDALKGRVFLDSGRDRPLVIAIRGQGGSLIVAPLVDPMIAELKRRKMAALIIDPFVQSHSAEENRNEEMNLVMSLWSYVASKANCAIWLVHHFRKGGQGGDAEAVRGAGAIQGAARSMYTISGMSVEEATNLGIPPDERWQYIRHDNVKQNMAAPAGSAAWYQLVDVNINNANDDYPEGDHVQSVALWKPPSPWAELSWERIEKILNRIEKGPEEGEFYAMSRQAGTRWAGQAIMDICQNSYAQATQVLKGWKESGLLIEGEYLSQQKRKTLACVRVDPTKFAEMRQAFVTPKGDPDV